jgi:hypothetical protein
MDGPPAVSLYRTVKRNFEDEDEDECGALLERY